MPANQLRIKGAKNGIIIQFEEGEIGQGFKLLEDKLRSNPSFFSGSNATIVLPEKTEIGLELLTKLGEVLRVGGVRLLEIRRSDSFEISQRIKDDLSTEDQTKRVVSTVDTLESTTLHWIEKRLRSGDKISVDGDLVLLGDVNPGALVSATGNILVWGSLQGVAHAGRDGDEKARIMALRLKASQLRIAGHISRAPDEYLDPNNPEVARVGVQGIVIEAWEKAHREQPLSFWRRLFQGKEVKL